MNGRRCLFLSLLCGICLSEVTQSPDQSGAELADAKIQCTHDIPDGNYDSIYWYYRKANTELTYIIHSYSEERNSGRFGVSVDRAKSSSILTIRALQPGDGAVYYCALQHTTALLFGSGTRLTVEPENPGTSSPSVFVVKSAPPKQSDGQKLTAACLAKDFYPKAIEVNMSRETDLVYKSKEGILSSNGKYSMIQVVKVDPNEKVECFVKHVEGYFNKTQLSAPISAPINNTQVCESSDSTFEEPNMEKVNMLSVTVLGLRVLLAKSIAFNMLMTVKLFIF